MRAELHIYRGKLGVTVYVSEGSERTFEISTL